MQGTPPHPDARRADSRRWKALIVTTGQKVRAGQLVGEVGNSGNTAEPHLHLHAERDGVGLDLAFTDVGGFFHRGRVIRN
ncbi:M23 family metallopeptidase [Streptomyces sp. NPDC059680]|uniref:M23 family metallopeptidase n=1 Tax=Streptomyces sp. NPDC059680 TaxID=3346904 RepID=UPI00368E8DFC